MAATLVHRYSTDLVVVGERGVGVGARVHVGAAHGRVALGLVVALARVARRLEVQRQRRHGRRRRDGRADVVRQLAAEARAAARARRAVAALHQRSHLTHDAHDTDYTILYVFEHYSLRKCHLLVYCISINRLQYSLRTLYSFTDRWITDCCFDIAFSRSMNRIPLFFLQVFVFKITMFISARISV